MRKSLGLISPCSLKGGAHACERSKSPAPTTTTSRLMFLATVCLGLGLCLHEWHQHTERPSSSHVATVSIWPKKEPRSKLPSYLCSYVGASLADIDKGPRIFFAWMEEEKLAFGLIILMHALLNPRRLFFWSATNAEIVTLSRSLLLAIETLLSGGQRERASLQLLYWTFQLERG